MTSQTLLSKGEEETRLSRASAHGFVDGTTYEKRGRSPSKNCFLSRAREATLSTLTGPRRLFRIAGSFFFARTMTVATFDIGNIPSGRCHSSRISQSSRRRRRASRQLEFSRKVSGKTTPSRPPGPNKSRYLLRNRLARCRRLPSEERSSSNGGIPDKDSRRLWQTD